MPKKQITRTLVDVPADNPVGTLDRFTTGLQRVLSVPKPTKKPTRRLATRAKRDP